MASYDIPTEIRAKLMLDIQGTLLTNGYDVEDNGRNLNIKVEDGSNIHVEFRQSSGELGYYNDYGWLKVELSRRDVRRQKVTFNWKKCRALAREATGVDKLDTAKLLKNVAEMVARSQSQRKRLIEANDRTKVLVDELTAIFPEAEHYGGSRRGYIESENISGYIEPGSVGQWRGKIELTLKGTLAELRQKIDSL